MDGLAFFGGMCWCFSSGHTEGIEEGLTWQLNVAMGAYRLNAIRHVGGHCPDYAKEKAIDEERKAAENKRKAIAGGITAQKSDGVYRAYRKNKPKRSGWKRKN